MTHNTNTPPAPNSDELRAFIEKKLEFLKPLPNDYAEEAGYHDAAGDYEFLIDEIMEKVAAHRPTQKENVGVFPQGNVPTFDSSIADRPTPAPVGDELTNRQAITKLVTDMTVDKSISEEYLIDELLAHQQRVVAAAERALAQKILDKANAHAKSIGLWGMEAAALNTIVMSGHATDLQKSELNAQVTERRALLLVTDFVNESLAQLTSETALQDDGKEREE